jgi:hypothetical protein
MPNVCDKQNNRAENYEQGAVQNLWLSVNRIPVLFKTMPILRRTSPGFEQGLQSFEQVLNSLSTGYEHLSRLLAQVLTIIVIEIWVIAWDKAAK